jgi:NAD dependent epimerase/dehydratase family enzyme
VPAVLERTGFAFEHRELEETLSTTVGRQDSGR